MEQTVAVTEMSNVEEIRVSLTEFKGLKLLDIRVFAEPYADEGQGRVPTKKGISLKVEKLPDLIAALQEAERQFRRAKRLATKDGAASPMARLEKCFWCGTEFRALKVGAHRKKFCSVRCKSQFHTAARRWAERSLAQGQFVSGRPEGPVGVVHDVRKHECGAGQRIPPGGC